MLYIIVAILIFGVLIATHELGHFATAKLLGVKVNEFSVGMGPAIWKKQRGNTLYSVRILPIGGYCAMEGRTMTPLILGPLERRQAGRKWLFCAPAPR